MYKTVEQNNSLVLLQANSSQSGGGRRGSKGSSSLLPCSLPMIQSCYRDVQQAGRVTKKNRDSIEVRKLSQQQCLYQQFRLEDKRTVGGRERGGGRCRRFLGGDAGGLLSANLICRSVCGMHSAHVTGVAEEVRVQRVALSAGLVGELLAALLTLVTLKVVVLVHGHDTQDLLTALCR